MDKKMKAWVIRVFQEINELQLVHFQAQIVGCNNSGFFHIRIRLNPKLREPYFG